MWHIYVLNSWLWELWVLTRCYTNCNTAVTAAVGIHRNRQHETSLSLFLDVHSCFGVYSRCGCLQKGHQCQSVSCLHIFTEEFGLAPIPNTTSRLYDQKETQATIPTWFNLANLGWWLGCCEFKRSCCNYNLIHNTHLIDILISPSKTPDRRK